VINFLSKHLNRFINILLWVKTMIKMSNKRYFLGIMFLLMLLPAMSANVNTVIIQIDGENNFNYDYAVIGRTYDLFVAGSGLQPINHPELQLVSNNSDNLFIYNFTPGTVAGTRTFNDGINSFDLSVLSEADELANAIGNVVITVNDDSSSVEISNLNLSNRAIRNFNFDTNEFSGLIDLGNFLAGLEFDIGFEKDQNYPNYNSLHINGGSSAGTVVGSILIFNHLSFDVNAINSNPSLLNEVIDAYNANIDYGFNAQAVKQGNDFYFWSDEGYSDLSEDNLTNVQEIILNKVKFISPDEVVNTLLPIGNFSEFKKFVDFEISVDFNNLALQDGEYTLNLIYTDKYGNGGEMPFTVVLDVTNIGSENENNNTITFTDMVISQTFQRIENLPSGINLGVILFGSNRPSGFVNAPSNIRALNYIEITPNMTVDAGNYNLYFKINKGSIPSSAKSNVRMYVQETSSWSVLQTSLINETSSHYEYMATLPHFSNFLIGYIQSSDRGSRNRDNDLDNSSDYPYLTGTNNSGNGIINLGNPPESAGFFSIITGAIIGALGTPAGMFTLIIIVAVVGLMIIFKAKRKSKIKKEKKEKLNNRGDEVDEP